MITHPDDLIEGTTYSVKIKGERGRVKGRFTFMWSGIYGGDIDSDVIDRAELIITLETNNGQYPVPWKRSKDWKEV